MSDKILGIIKMYSDMNLNDEIIFMNDGYMELDNVFLPINDMTFKLDPKYIFFKNQARLYYKVICEGNIFTGAYLDLSCGRGGGTMFARDNFSFNKIIGVDINDTQIDFCKNKWPEIDFYVGSAEKIPITDSTVDLITSIEASGYYHNVESYFNECHRVLRDNGILVVAGRYLELPKEFVGKFKLTKKIDITTNVNISCAINKYSLPLNVNDANTKQKIRAALFNDEKRYIVNNEKYLIAVYAKI